MKLKKQLLKPTRKIYLNATHELNKHVGLNIKFSKGPGGKILISRKKLFRIRKI